MIPRSCSCNISLTVGCGLGDGASGLISTSSAGPSCTGSSSPVIAHQCCNSDENIEAFWIAWLCSSA